jgi:hypothetical protein
MFSHLYYYNNPTIQIHFYYSTYYIPFFLSSNILEVTYLHTYLLLLVVVLLQINIKKRKPQTTLTTADNITTQSTSSDFHILCYYISNNTMTLHTIGYYWSGPRESVRWQDRQNRLQTAVYVYISVCLRVFAIYC